MTIQDLATFSTTTSMAVLLLTIPFGFVFLLLCLAVVTRLSYFLPSYALVSSVDALRPLRYFQIRRDCFGDVHVGVSIGVGSFIIAGMILSVRPQPLLLQRSVTITTGLPAGKYIF